MKAEEEEKTWGSDPAAWQDVWHVWSLIMGARGQRCVWS